MLYEPLHVSEAEIALILVAHFQSGFGGTAQVQVEGPAPGPAREPRELFLEGEIKLEELLCPEA